MAEGETPESGPGRAHVRVERSIIWSATGLGPGAHPLLDTYTLTP